ncbi:T9SS type A sorting domain-containing protein [Aquimarina aquimarini]|uniref:T9SS type A sorting domain-containing protein n=1 Tax=Aquimarina aquimarini TaxID=1191734 RepID=UPI000D554B6F|nr:T9SS type A sorting domain-containing protein [Aquimarina aquimarini]
MKEIQLYKNILGIVLLFLTLHVQAQVSVGGTANYKLELSLTQKRGFSNCDGDGGIYYMILKGNTDIEMYSGSRFQFPEKTKTFTEEFNSPNAFDYIQIDAASKRSKKIGGCRSSQYHNDRRVQLSKRTCYSTSGNLSFQHADDFFYRARVFPVVSINQPNNSAYLANDEFLTITLPDNIDPSYYNWEYSIREGKVDGPFLPFPSTVNGRVTNNIARLRIRGDEFLTDNEFGKIINIRVNPKCGIGVPSDPIPLEYLKSVPRIINKNPTDVSCYDSTDGSVYITFDGPLDPNLKGINIFIEDFSRPSGVDSNQVPTYEVVMTVNNIKELDANNGILIEDIPPSNPPTANNTRIRLFGEGYYTDASGHTANVNIGRPDFVSFDIINTIPIWCRGGQDGEIVLQASGGTNKGYQYTYKLEGETKADDWKPFSNDTTHTIKNLPPGKYEVKVRDANQCLAKIPFTDTDGTIKLGNPLIRKTEITQPDATLEVTTKILNHPTAFGFEDGRILATMTGGTLISGNRYTYEWRDQNNNLVNTTSAIYNAGQGYLVTLHSVGQGSYRVSVRDANYTSATDKEGCMAISEVVNLVEPPKLKVRIEEYHPISCNNNNEYSDQVDTNVDTVPDQFQDGALIAYAEGGVPFDIMTPDFNNPYPIDDQGNLLPYFFNWKQQLPNGSWVDVPQKGTIITFLSTANYALNITDKNNIVLGTYAPITLPDGSRKYELVTALDEPRFLPQPDKLVLSFTHTSPSCLGGNDANAMVHVSGGIPPYTYSWSNGETTDAITNLIGGRYVVFITDARGCQLEGRLMIEQPNGIEIKPIMIKHPTCIGYNDGKITLDITGGTPPYSYQWIEGSTAATSSIDQIIAGTYLLQITDNQGCVAFYEETLIDPDPIEVDLGEDRSLCLEQSLLLDIKVDDPNASYYWSADNGFSSTNSTVEIVQPGIYTATLTTGIGCIGIDTIVVDVFDTPIDARFLLTTQAYTDEEVILVNISEPIGDRVVWTVPEGVTIVSESKDELIAVFPEATSYDIHLRSYQGDCYEDFIKTVIVEEAVALQVNTGDFIEEFIVYPNPNDGTFKTKVSLAEDANIVVKIINLLSGTTVHERSEKNKQEFLLEYSISLPSGVYLMLLETPKGSEIRKLVVE